MHRLRCVSGFAFALVLLAAIAALAQESQIVVMIDAPAKYRPNPLKIKVGQTVKWINTGETVHTVTADPSQAPDPTWASLPKGAEMFDSGYMNAGDTWSYTFKVPGVYRYFCLTHEEEGMKGEIDVEK